MRPEIKEAVKEFINAAQTDDIAKSDELAKAIITKKLQDRFDIAKQGVEESD